MIPVTLGVDLGQRADPTALVVCERQSRPVPGGVDEDGRVLDGIRVLKGDRIVAKVRSQVHYIGRHVERLPLGTPYTEVAARVAQVVGRLRERGCETPTIHPDATGVGSPVVEMLRLALRGLPHRMVPVTLTGTDRLERVMRGGFDELRVGKLYLVARLQALLQTGRVALPQTAEAVALKRELLGFETRARTRSSGDEYGAFKVGAHDDLVVALGLATLDEGARPAVRATVDDADSAFARWEGWR